MGEGVVRWAGIMAAGCLVLVGCGESPSSAGQTPVASPQVLLDLDGSGTKSTDKFTVAADWNLNWAYDCTAGLTRDGAIPSGYHCSFIVHVTKPDGHLSLENQGVSQLGVKDQGRESYHTGGTFYLAVEVCCADNTWSVRVTG
jgi:hypothetical protein